MIHIKKLYKKYGENIIFSDLKFSVKKKEFVAIIGTSGSGKTTLLNMIAGLTSYDSGLLSVNKTELNSLDLDKKTKFRGKNISFIFQNFNLVDNLTVEENIDLVLEINSLERRYQTDEILEKVGLQHKKDAYPFNLSGGEQQRVAIARAFVGKTPILLADEPTGNLDEVNSEKIMSLIQELHAESGNSILMITHDLEIAKKADTIYQVKNNTLQLYNV